MANDTAANGRDKVALDDDGALMVTPHAAGTGALLLQMHPEWEDLPGIGIGEGSPMRRRRVRYRTRTQKNNNVVALV